MFQRLAQAASVARPGTKAALSGPLLAAEEAPPPGQERLRRRKAVRCWHLYVVQVCGEGSAGEDPSVVCPEQNNEPLF